MISLSYSKGDLFEVMLDDGEFVGPINVRSIIVEDKIYLWFDGVRYIEKRNAEEVTTEGLPHFKILLPDTVKLEYKEVSEALENKIHKVKISEMNRCGEVVKDTIYYGCTSSSLIVSEDNVYKFTMNIPGIYE